MAISDGAMGAAQVFIAVGVLGALGLVAMSLCAVLIPLAVRRATSRWGSWVVLPWMINVALQWLQLVAVAMVVVGQTGGGFWATVWEVANTSVGATAGVMLLVHSGIVAIPTAIEVVTKRTGRSEQLVQTGRDHPCDQRAEA
ncbi:hypothetical protein [Nesterenkonia sp. K-15-9-6]|uniref:hypothetical protein n=1 Tax=Nesterenkonia sp. K-15-9-6 TaxID=3093918 RepID=UPI0040439D07